MKISRVKQPLYKILLTKTELKTLRAVLGNLSAITYDELREGNTALGNKISTYDEFQEMYDAIADAIEDV